MVLRPSSPLAAAEAIAALDKLGVQHVEIAWQSGDLWIAECRELMASFPALRLGAASIHSLEGLESARRAGFTYAVSPLLDPELCLRAGPDLVLVPGVMTPSEVGRARRLGCRLVKLFPAVTLGPGYWRRLAAPLGEPLPLCIAAGGLGPADVIPWLQAGVDAVALGSGLATTARSDVPREASSDLPKVDDPDPFAALRAVLATLAR